MAEMNNPQIPPDDIEMLPDEEEGGGRGEKKLAKLREELERCEKERKEYLEGWQRAKADFINYRNDEARRFEDMARFVSGGLIEDLLPVIDSFDLALSHGLPTDVEKGVLLIRSQFEDVLKKRGLEEIIVKPGETFNPERQESIGEMDSGEAVGTIAEVVQRGYMLRGKVLRPARVRLSKQK